MHRRESLMVNYIARTKMTMVHVQEQPRKSMYLIENVFSIFKIQKTTNNDMRRACANTLNFRRKHLSHAIPMHMFEVLYRCRLYSCSTVFLFHIVIRTP